MAAGGAARGTYAEQGPLGEGLQKHPTREGDIRRFAEVDGRRRLRDEGTEGRVVSLAGEVLDEDTRRTGGCEGGVSRVSPGDRSAIDRIIAEAELHPVDPDDVSAPPTRLRFLQLAE